MDLGIIEIVDSDDYIRGHIIQIAVCVSVCIVHT